MKKLKGRPTGMPPAPIEPVATAAEALTAAASAVDSALAAADQACAAAVAACREAGAGHAEAESTQYTESLVGAIETSIREMSEAQAQQVRQAHEQANAAIAAALSRSTPGTAPGE